jgi:hypothetical protein
MPSITLNFMGQLWSTGRERIRALCRSKAPQRLGSCRPTRHIPYSRGLFLGIRMEVSPKLLSMPRGLIC